LESNPLKHLILRHASTILGLEFDSIPPLHKNNAISTSIREASQAVDNPRLEKAHYTPRTSR